MDPVIVVHGGAWAIPDSLADLNREGVKAAAVKGLKLLKEGRSAVDVVEAAVTVLEDDPVFDAGTGSVLNASGEVQMDAVIMNGADLGVGSIACVQNISNPVQLARLIMDKTDHTMLVGAGANELASELGMPTVSPEQLVTEEARLEFEKFTKYQSTVKKFFSQRSDHGHDTVGAVAVDRQGNMAFATSTGGITGKQAGRVGDSPLIGCGGYADSTVGAVSTTGHGESITKVCLAHHIIMLMKTGHSVQQATEEALCYMMARVGGSGGAIAIDRAGEVGLSFSTARMAWAWAKDSELHHGLEPGEDIINQLTSVIMS